MQLELVQTVQGHFMSGLDSILSGWENQLDSINKLYYKIHFFFNFILIKSNMAHLGLQHCIWSAASDIYLCRCPAAVFTSEDAGQRRVLLASARVWVLQLGSWIRSVFTRIHLRPLILFPHYPFQETEWAMQSLQQL